MKKFLFITSLFPPLGGSGVQRQLYYIHYARDFGWEPVVLTVKNVIYHEYDKSLFSYVPADMQVERTNSLEFGRILWLVKHLFHNKINHVDQDKKPYINNKILNLGRSIRDWVTIVDDRVLWIPFAFKRALQIIREGGIDLIVARGGPMSNTVAGYLISKAAHKPLVLDLADPWLEYPYQKFPTAFHFWINKFLERKVFQHALKISVACPQIKHDLHRKYPKFREEDVEVVTNGFDPAQFISAPLFPQVNKFVITHVGVLKWYRLQAFYTFIQALSKIVKENPNLVNLIEFRHVGSFDVEIQNHLETSGLINCTRLIGYCPHNEAIAHMKNADLLLLPISEEMSNKNGVYVIPGKLFEYIGSGKPILMIGPMDSDTYRVILGEELGYAFSVEQAKEVGDCLKSLVENNSFHFQAVRDDNLFQQKVKKYERRTLASRFIKILDTVLDENR